MILTYCTPDKYLELHKGSIKSKEEYAKINNYEIESVIRDSSDPYLEKLIIIKEYLSKHDWIFFSDADSFVINNIGINEFLKYDTPLIMGSQTQIGDTSIDLNSGNIIFKNCPESFDILDKLIHYYFHVDNVNYDQGAFNLLFSREAKEYKPLLTLDKRLNSTLGNTKDEDLILHLFNKSFHEKLEYINKSI